MSQCHNKHGRIIVFISIGQVLRQLVLGQQVTGQLRVGQGHQAHSFLLDVADEGSIGSFFSRIRQEFSRLDILVNCAGIDVTKPVDELSIEEWDRVLDVNLRGPFIMCKMAVEMMYPARSGHIVNITSTAAKRAWPNASVYHASKWGLLGFSVVLVLVAQMEGQPDLAALTHAAWEIGGALALGLSIGGPAALLTGRLRDGEPLQIEALSLVFLTAGLSLWLGVSFLLTGMVVGAVIVNLAAHHTKAFNEIAHIQWPFVVLFFILAGAALDVGVAMTLGGVGAGFVIMRALARVIGGWLGATLAREPRQLALWYGMALLPQAGVAIGMALIAAQRFPQWGAQIIALTIGTTVVFEILGPIATLYAIKRASTYQ